MICQCVYLIDLLRKEVILRKVIGLDAVSCSRTFLADDVSEVEIRHVDVDVRRSNATSHDLDNMQAFNTDGLDVAGKNVWIHDCNIWNDDDCVCVKQQTGYVLGATPRVRVCGALHSLMTVLSLSLPPSLCSLRSNSFRSKCSENMLFERINASGVGLTIGSIGPANAHSCVRNVTFRDCYMKNTFKGLYLKSRPGQDAGTGEIRDVLYENIVIDNPTQWAVWIGPQQAVYDGACSLLWPYVNLDKGCPVPLNMVWDNLVFRNITINNPAQSPGVIWGNEAGPMSNIVFDNVVVNGAPDFPFGDAYLCRGVKGGVAKGGTNPAPSCFESHP